MTGNLCPTWGHFSFRRLLSRKDCGGLLVGFLPRPHQKNQIPKGIRYLGCIFGDVSRKQLPPQEAPNHSEPPLLKQVGYKNNPFWGFQMQPFRRPPQQAPQIHLPILLRFW